MYKNYSELGRSENKQKDQYNILELQNFQQKQQILSQNKLVCVDIFADWCGPCRQISPSYSILATTYNKPGLCLLVKENLSKNLSSDIHGVPTFHFFVQGQLVDKIVGADLEIVEKKLNYYLNQIRDQSTSYSTGPATNKNSIRRYATPYQGEPFDSDSKLLYRPNY
jgi:thioredoxin 1